MNDVTQIVRKVRQAPWRVQRQWVVLFMLGLVVVAMVAWVYLNVTVRATLAGREIQQLRNPSLVNPDPTNQPNSIATNLRINTELETTLAQLTSVEAMQKRAEEMGFEPVTPEDMLFVTVPGYPQQTTVNLSTSGENKSAVPVILPAYTESWIDFFLNQQAPVTSAGGRP